MPASSVLLQSSISIFVLSLTAISLRPQRCRRLIVGTLFNSFASSVLFPSLPHLFLFCCHFCYLRQSSGELPTDPSAAQRLSRGDSARQRRRRPFPASALLRSSSATLTSSSSISSTPLRSSLQSVVTFAATSTLSVVVVLVSV